MLGSGATMQDEQDKDAATPRFKVVELIDALGGAIGVRSAALQAGYEPLPYRTIQNWKTRGQAPADGVALLFVLGLDKLALFDPFDYVEGAK